MKKWLTYLLFFYLTLVFIGSVLMPPVNFISLDNFLFPFAFLVVVYTYYKNKGFQLLFLSLSLLCGVMTISNASSNGLSIPEVFVVLRWFKILTVGFAAYHVYQERKLLTESLLTIGFLLVVLINSMQLLEVKFFVELYAPKQGLLDLLNTTLLDARVYGTMLNPNINGLCLVLFATYFIVSDIKWKYVYAVMAALLLIMTQSRTAFIALVLISLFVFSFYLVRRNRKILIALFGGFALILLLLLQFKFNNLTSLFDGTAFTSNSVTTRFEMIKNVLDVNQTNLLLGQGKVRDIPSLIGGSVDNEYAYVYLEYGLLGLVSIAVVIIALIWLVVKKSTNKYTLGIIGVMMICGITNLSFSSLEIGPLFALLVGISFFSVFNNSRNSIENKEYS
jgi:O-antigen ligase